VVNPDDLTARFGSDTVRCLLMFIGPWDQGGPWNPSSIEGVHRFLGRVWSVAQATGGGHPRAIPVMPLQSPGGWPPSMGEVGIQEVATIEGGVRALRQATHRAIKEVGDDYGAFHFNTALSKMMELTNALGAALMTAGRDRCLRRCGEGAAPPAGADGCHITEELWSRRGKPYSIHQQAWPT
jgi:leucyl-tRNA synthetase